MLKEFWEKLGEDAVFAETFHECTGIEDLVKKAAELGFEISEEEIAALSDEERAELLTAAGIETEELEPDEISAEDLAKVAGGRNIKPIPGEEYFDPGLSFLKF